MSDTKPELKKITQEELNGKLAEYKQWREKGRRNNERYDELSQHDLRNLSFPQGLALQGIDLRSVNLSGSNLTGVDLTRANLSDANLSGSNLTGVDLTRANLSDANFSGSNLTGVDLTRANLSDANLSGANLSSAKLAWTDLTGADFSGATLTDAKFCRSTSDPKNIEFGSLRATNDKPTVSDPDKFVDGATLVETKFLNAIMRGANLTGTKTAGMQLGGADVTNAILPDEIKTFDGLKTVEEASKIAKRLFTMLLTALGFSALTILSTKDHLLLTNAITSPLPLIQTPMPLAGFYWIAPFLLTIFFIYFLLNLLHLYKLISRLPAVFPDGTPLDEKIFPWLLNTLVREYFPLLSCKKKPLFSERKFLMVLLVWWSTPIVLFGFWLRYLPRHDPWGSGLHIVWIGLVITAIIVTYNKTIQILKNNLKYIWWWKYILISLGLIVLDFSINVTAFVQYGDFEGVVEWKEPLTGLKIPWRRWLIADLTEQEVSHKPDNWNPERPAEGVKGANLEGANLDYADARGAFLVNAKLKGASLKHAKLSGAILVRSMLDGKADLTHAELKYARLESSNLIGAILTEVNLTGANLEGAILSGADLIKADLTDADLFGANLKVDPGDKKVTVITPAQIKSAKNWQLAVYDRSFNEEQLRLTDPEISSALKLFIKESSPTLSNEEVGKLYEKEMKQYRVHYGWPTGEKTK